LHYTLHNPSQSIYPPADSDDMPYPTSAQKESGASAYGTLECRYVDLLHTRFPHVQAIADELLSRSQSFRELVEEYGVCADALDRCSKEGTGTALLEQYTMLRFALERVLLQYIKDHRHSDDLT
jgi:hypothetical protein